MKYIFAVLLFTPMASFSYTQPVKEKIFSIENEIRLADKKETSY